MNKCLKWMGVLVGAVLAVGCGGVVQDEAPQEEVSQGETPPEQVGTLGVIACCYINCSSGWHGPFPSVHYGNCANYGEYYCRQHGWYYVGAKWAPC